MSGRGRKTGKGPSLRPRLTVTQILRWADAYRRRTGKWPGGHSGAVLEASGETWQNVEAALRAGYRGLRGGSSVAQLLARHRGKRSHLALPQLTIEQIVAWADNHHKRTGEWPKTSSGPVHKAPAETWGNINRHLRAGSRGLPGGSSLARLLAEKRGVRNRRFPPRLTVKQILAWADAHHKRTGTWPSVD